MGPNTDSADSTHSAERKHRRFALQLPVSLKFTTGTDIQEFPAISKNVSVGGMLLEASSAIPQDCTINFTLTVNKESAVRPIHLVGQGKVVRVESPESGKFTIAVECSRPISELAYLAAS